MINKPSFLKSKIKNKFAYTLHFVIFFLLFRILHKSEKMLVIDYESFNRE